MPRHGKAPGDASSTEDFADAVRRILPPPVPETGPVDEEEYRRLFGRTLQLPADDRRSILKVMRSFLICDDVEKLLGRVVRDTPPPHNSG